MQIWYTHNNQTHISGSLPGNVLPILDRNDQQHIVRWGASRHDDPRFPRGMWYRKDPLNRWGATWVRIPAIRYEQLTMHKGPRIVELEEPLAGALLRVPGAGVRVYLADSDTPGETTVTPLRFSQLTPTSRQ